MKIYQFGKMLFKLKKQKKSIKIKVRRKSEARNLNHFRLFSLLSPTHASAGPKQLQ